MLDLAHQASIQGDREHKFRSANVGAYQITNASATNVNLTELKYGSLSHVDTCAQKCGSARNYPVADEALSAPEQTQGKTSSAIRIATAANR